MSTWGKGSSRKPSNCWRPRSQQPKAPIPSTTPPPLGDLIHCFQKEDIDAQSRDHVEAVAISNCQPVTSFSWVNKADPTIIIPGKPPKWIPIKYPSAKLDVDRGQYFRDRNAAHFPQHPMEPAAIAVLDADPSLPGKVDIFACGSTLGNLLRFVRGEGAAFRMLAEDVHGTIFLTRRENSPTELIADVRGFGHTFPEMYTTWDFDVKESTSNQRLVRYELGGYAFLVRCEADGYISNGEPSSSSSPRPVAAAGTFRAAAAAAGRNDGDASFVTAKIDEMADLFGQMSGGNSVLPKPGGNNSSPPTALKVIRGGRFVEQSSVFDLKTRSIRTRDKKDHLEAELPRLWVRQIPNFILAYHLDGLFKKEDIEVKDVREKTRQWEADHAVDIARFVALVDEIVHLVWNEPSRKVEICRPSGKLGMLEVRKQAVGANPALSDGVKAQWQSSATEDSREQKGY